MGFKPLSGKTNYATADKGNNFIEKRLTQTPLGDNRLRNDYTNWDAFITIVKFQPPFGKSNCATFYNGATKCNDGTVSNPFRG